MATAFKIDSPLIDPLDVSRASLYADHQWQAPFKVLRETAPVHYCAHSEFGPYWSLSTYKPIQYVEALPDIFSSDYLQGGITIADRDMEDDNFILPMFIAMDRPKHTDQRRVVSPAFTPSEMKRMTDSIRARTGEVLDSLP